MRRPPLHKVTYTFVHYDTHGDILPTNAIYTSHVWTDATYAQIYKVFDHRTNPESSMRVIAVGTVADNARTPPSNTTWSHS